VSAPDFSCGEKISGETIRRALHRRRFVFRRPKLWSGPGGKEPEEISKALEEVRKGTALLLYGDETTFHLLPVLRRMWMKVGEEAKILTPSGWKKVKEWLSKHERMHLIYLPPRSPRLNPVEPLWRWLKGEVAANRTYTDLEPLKLGCEEQLISLTPEDALRITGVAN